MRPFSGVSMKFIRLILSVLCLTSLLSTVTASASPRVCVDSEKTDINKEVWASLIATQFDPEEYHKLYNQPLLWLSDRYVWNGPNGHKLTYEDGLIDISRVATEKMMLAFKDLKITNSFSGCGDKLTNHFHFEGVHVGEYLGINPTGKKVRWNGVAVGRFENGRLAEEWEFWDDLKVILNSKSELNESKNSLSDNISMWNKVIEEKINQGVFDRIYPSYSKKYIYYGVGDLVVKADSLSWEEMIEPFNRLRSAFSDIKIKNDIFGFDDRAVNHFTLTGTHDGEWQGIKATGKKIAVSGIAIVRFSNGEIIEEWEFWDEISLLKQLGVLSGKADYSVLDITRRLSNKEEDL